VAVKCDIPNLALEFNHALIYGFGCNDVTAKIIRNYIEYLNCSGVDYSFCEDYPCVQPEGTVLCFIDDVNLTLGVVTINTASVSFTVPSQPYAVELIKISDDSVVNTQQSPVSPINYTGLIPNTNYKVRFTLLFTGGETKIE
jgi:hypothetical protein